MRYSWFSFGESKCKPWKGSAYDIEIENEWYKEQTKKAKMALILVNEMKRDLICSWFWIWGSTDLCVCVYLLWVFGKNHTAQKDQQLRTNGTTRNTFRNRFFFLSLCDQSLFGPTLYSIFVFIGFKCSRANPNKSTGCFKST